MPQQAAKLARRKCVRYLREIGIARPCKSFACVERRCGRMCARKAMSCYDEVAVAGYAAIRIPARRGQKLIEDERLERRSGCGKRVCGLRKVMRSQHSICGDVEHDNASVWSVSSRTRDCSLPRVARQLPACSLHGNNGCQRKR